MTDKELIQALRKVHDAYFTPGVHSHSIYGHAADRLEALMAENERLKEQMPKWRPASEPPETIPCIAGTEYSEAVNVLTSGRKVLTAIYNGHEFITDADFWEAWDEEITHWAPVPMPLPSTEGVE